MNGNRESLLAAKRALLTVDYLSSLEASELFSKSLVGQEFELIDLYAHKTQTTTSGDAVRMVKYERVGKINTWYLTSFMKNCKVSSVEASVNCPVGISLANLASEHQGIVLRFKVEGFEPASDNDGNPLYSLRVYSESKVRKYLKASFDDFIQRGWSEAKGEAVRMVRAHSNLFVDSLCDESGRLTPESENKYRLGTLLIKVIEVI